MTATFAGMASGTTAAAAAGAAWDEAGALAGACAKREEAARPVANAVAKTRVRFMRFMRCLRLLTRIRIPEISAGSLPAQSAAGKAAAPSSARGTPEGVASLLYLIKMKERVAGARGQSADRNYRRHLRLGQSMSVNS
jgi:type IV secretory pathway TrbL component